MTNEQRAELHDALFSAFPAESEFGDLIYLHFGMTLDAIASDGTLPHRITEVLQWAETNERIDALVDAAVRARPQSPALRDYKERWSKPGGPREAGPEPRAGKPTRPIPISLMPRTLDQLYELVSFAIVWFATLALIAFHVLGYLPLRSVAVIFAALLGVVWMFRRAPAGQ
jgi:hypothetical protein